MQNTLGGNDDILIQSPIHQLEGRRRRRHQAAWAGLSLLMIGSLLAVHFQGFQGLTASILPTKQAPAFDGTVYPVEKTPNWVALKSEEYKYNYEQIASEKLTEMPIYNAGNLARGVETLKWGNSADDAIRNQKITYSVPYMGSYRLNGKEHDGSHLAIDIKVPRNTPVRAIANGVVTKISNATAGFGKHIVIQHTDVPSLENSSVKTTYYSSYSHLGTIVAIEGDVVLRGQNIALSGETGFATTPHIHFQLDRDDAPWHPFWAFTFQEQAAAGLDFVGAINAGLGKEKALQYTLNPMSFIQAHLNTTPQVSVPVPVPPAPAPVPVAPPVEPPVTHSPIVEPAPTLPAPPVTPPTPAVPIFSFTQKSSYQLGEEVRVTIQVRDTQGVALSTLSEPALILLSGDVGTLSLASINSSDLRDGQLTLQIQAPKVGQGQVTIVYQGIQTKSAPFDVVSPVVVTPAPTPAPVPQEVKPVAVNRPTLFADVLGVSPFYDAIKYVKQKDIFDGYRDGNFKPDQVISRVEVLKVALKSSNRPLLPTQGALSYQDIDPDAWYIPYIATAQLNGITQGYIGGYFKPNQNVTRAEFLKIFLLATPVSIEPTVNETPYSDIEKDDWYAVFAQYAKQKNLLPNTEGGFKPNEEITRAEVAEIIYRMLLVMKSGSSAYTAALASN